MTDTFQIAVIPGDGIGTEVTEATLAVLDAVQRRINGYHLSYTKLMAGAAYYSDTEQDMEASAELRAGQADAIYLGAIGLPTVRALDGTEIAPHLRLREQFELFAGLRPVRAHKGAPLALSDSRAKALDLIIIRESTEGLFYTAAVHNRSPKTNADEARETLRLTRSVTERLCDFAFTVAERRKARGKKGEVTCVDKANVFKAFAFFRQIFDERAANFPHITTRYNYVDAQALDLVKKPWDFDVLVMENMFGDILSDLSGGLVGGMGMAASAEIGDNHCLFQPAHGSAPDIMGQDKANPLAAILSGGLMLDWLGYKSDNEKLITATRLIDKAIEDGFAAGELRPIEFGGDMGLKEMTKVVIDNVHKAEIE